MWYSRTSSGPTKSIKCVDLELPILRYLARQPQIATITVMQGYYGARSAKPTKLMITHPSPQLERIMRENRTRETLPLKSSIGKLDDGTDATSSLKTYPPGLCTALAAAWGHSLQRRTLPGTSVDPPNHLAEAFNSLHSTVDDNTTLGPDFCTAAQYQPV